MMSRHSLPLPVNVDALAAAVDKVGEDLPCVGTVLLWWVTA